MNKVLKLIAGAIGIFILTLSIMFLFTHDMNAKIFIAQSIIDNAIFCTMFIAVILITGISC